MKANGKIGSSGVWVLDNVEKRFETNIYHYYKTLYMFWMVFQPIIRSSRLHIQQ